jgi:hypothetical protein
MLALAELLRLQKRNLRSGRNSQRSALLAFQSLNAAFVGGGDFREVANKLGVSPEDSIVFLRRLGQALHVRREQLQTLSQSFVSFG